MDRYIELIGWKGKILSTYSVILNRYQIIGDSELAPNTKCRNGFRWKEYPTFEIKKSGRIHWDGPDLG
nr:hypothetical protein [bacterium]